MAMGTARIAIAEQCGHVSTDFTTAMEILIPIIVVKQGLPVLISCHPLSPFAVQIWQSYRVIFKLARKKSVADNFCVFVYKAVSFYSRGICISHFCTRSKEENVESFIFRLGGISNEIYQPFLNFNQIFLLSGFLEKRQMAIIILLCLKSNSAGV